MENNGSEKVSRIDSMMCNPQLWDLRRGKATTNKITIIYELVNAWWGVINLGFSGMFCLLLVSRLMRITRETDTPQREFPREFSQQRGGCKRRALRLWRVISTKPFRSHESKNKIVGGVALSLRKTTGWKKTSRIRSMMGNQPLGDLRREKATKKK